MSTYSLGSLICAIISYQHVYIGLETLDPLCRQVFVRIAIAVVEIECNLTSNTKSHVYVGSRLCRSPGIR